MTEIEELLESTLNRAASEVGAPAGLADHAVAAAGRIQRRRRAAGATSVAVVAVAAVAIAAVTGSSGERRAAPVESPTPVTSVSATNLISGSPAPSESDSPSTTHRPSVVSALAGLHLLFAFGTTIHDGTKTIDLDVGSLQSVSIEALARLGDGYVVSLEGPGEETVARVDRDGNIHHLDDLVGDDTGGARGLAVSVDEKSIAYARWKTTSKGTVSTFRVIDTSGHLLHSASKDGPYRVTANFPGQVWLTSVSDDASQPPAAWDLAHNTVQDVSVGHQTTIQAVDLRRKRLLLGSGDCGTNIVSTAHPHSVIAHRCGVYALNLSPAGSPLVAVRVHGDSRDLVVLNSTDLRTLWSKADLPFYSSSSWTSDGRLIGYDLSRLIIIDPKAKTVTVEQVTPNESDQFTMAANS